MSAVPALATSDSEQLRHFLDSHSRIFLLTGAGISTASGIPDYRDANGNWKRRAPVTYQDFLRDPALRARYWARSFVGWPMVERAQPNAAHRALVELEARGCTTALVTQNVDGLHERAGHRDVIDLHGRIDRAVCLDCAKPVARVEIQKRLIDEHPDWVARTASFAPDGDADLDDVDFSTFRPPICDACGGLLKPDVVFFGENVPRERYASACRELDEADAMLAIGTSLMVYSGYRFARMAREKGLPLAILTRGVTRADGIATLKIDAECAPVLSAAIGVD
jgi:NAD-dependent SIR2 family protein deacetylase